MVDWRGLLKRNARRQLEILEQLISLDECEADKLSEIVKMDVKTLNRDVIEINELIHPLAIIKTTDYKFYLKIPQNYNSGYIYTVYLSSNLEFQLLEILLDNETHTFLSLSEKLFVSVSSVRRSIARINQIAKNVGFQIQTRPLKIVGDETKIINFFCFYFIEKYTLTSKLYNNFELKVLDDILKNILVVFNRKVTFVNLEYAKWIFMINISRMRNQNYWDQSPNKRELKMIFNQLNTNKLFKNRFEAVFKLPFTEKVLYQVSYVLTHSNFAATEEELLAMKQKDLSVTKRLQAIETILNQIKEFFNCELKNPNLPALLYNITQSYYGPSYVLNDTNRIFLEMIRNEWSVFYDLLKEIYQQSPKLLEPDQFSMFTFMLITNWPELMANFVQSRKRMKVGLYFLSTHEHIRFIHRNLQTHLADLAQISILDTSEQSENLFSEIDVLVTNINQLQAPVPIICMTQNMTSNEMEKIANYYQIWILENKE